MSIRGIAGVGVALCVAMTSFSIYLGIVEHVYVRPQVRTVQVLSYSGGEFMGRSYECYAVTKRRGTTTTTDRAAKVKAEPCAAEKTHKKHR